MPHSDLPIMYIGDARHPGRFFMDCIIFSPTGTTRSIVTAIAEGMDQPIARPVDLTFPACVEPEAADDGPVIIGTPVYGGRVPALAAQRLRQHIRGDGRPAVLVVVYGNRAFDDALLELRDLAEELGFVPVAGAAFIGEHSFSTAAVPVAEGRPDTADADKARAFGQAVRARLDATPDLSALPRLEVPGNYPHRDGAAAMAVSPETLQENCVLCGECARACPTGAIVVTAESVETDTALCLRCCACIRACHYAGRLMLHPKVLEFGRILNDKFSRRAEPETFL